MRLVNIRGLRSRITKQILEGPFFVTKNGQVIAQVIRHGPYFPEKPRKTEKGPAGPITNPLTKYEQEQMV